MSDLFMLLFFICICISFYFFIKFFIAIFKKREKKKNFKKAIFVLLLGFLCGVIATHFMPKEKNNFQHVAIQIKEDQKIAEKEQKTQNIEQNVKSEPKINIKKEDTKTAIPQYTYTITHQLPSIKLSVDCVIEKPVDKETLHSLSENLFKKLKGKNFENVFILWYLPFYKKDSGAWAVVTYKESRIVECRIIALQGE